MTPQNEDSPTERDNPVREMREQRGERANRRRLIQVTACVCAAAVLAAAAAALLALKTSVIKDELESATQLISPLKSNIVDGNQADALANAEQLRTHAAAAGDAARDPLWTLASALPWIGANFTAVGEIARSADDVATLGISPLVKVFDSLSWESLMPHGSGTNLGPIQEASPSVASAAHAVRATAARLEAIELTGLLPQISEPLVRAREQLRKVTSALDAGADAAQLAPGMLGADGERNYLLMIQNNAEVRASGGIPGGLAILTLDSGKLTMSAQSSAGELGIMSPPLHVDAGQEQIYSTRLGTYMQDVNLTPDFPTAASTARAMWQKRNNQRVDGVISIDPVALGYVLKVTGPVQISDEGLLGFEAQGLPTQLDSTNVVRTLLSDAYTKIEHPAVQDAYFAGVAREIFGALSSGKADAKALLSGLTRASSEGRVLLWSAHDDAQSVIAKYSMSGSIAGPSVAPAQFGVYFNDGTGAKMDYYVTRTAQLIEQCTGTAYGEVKVRITSTNTAPVDAATSLPAYVTGGGDYGVPPGSVQTNVIAYGPVQALVEIAEVDGQKKGFTANRHANRPVGSVTIRLAPGESRTVEFTFSKIVQHTEPRLFVTPSVQPVNKVVLPAELKSCESPTKTGD